MTNGWRRMTETARQKWHLSLEKNFRPTCNARNEAMFRDASKFAAHLRTVEKDLTTWQKDLTTTFDNMRVIMLAPLPRVYEEGHNQTAVPTEPEPRMIGGDVQVDRLTAASTDMKKRMDSEVVQPVKQWMVAFRTIQERMGRLEALRLELDSRRRTVSDLQGRMERLRANLGSNRVKGEADMEITQRKQAHKEDKMRRTASQYQEMETTVYNSLYTLINDTSVLRDYTAAAILIMHEAFEAGYKAFEPSGVSGAYSTSDAQAGNARAASENKYSAVSNDKISAVHEVQPRAKQSPVKQPAGAYTAPRQPDDRAANRGAYGDQSGGGYSEYELPSVPTHAVPGHPGQVAYQEARYTPGGWAQQAAAY